VWYLLLGLGCIPLFSVGLVFAIDGRIEPRDAGREFLVGFVEPGAECKERYGLRLHATSGEPLGCISRGLQLSPGRQQLGLGRFSRAQYDEVIALAADRASNGGLQPDDRRDIQRKVDAIAATLPPPAHPWLWGQRKAWLGWAMLVAAAADMFYLIRAFRRMAAAS
jgi:hypothetical protein